MDLGARSESEKAGTFDFVSTSSPTQLPVLRREALNGSLHELLELEPGVLLALLRFNKSTLEPKKLRNCFRRLIPHQHHPGSAMTSVSTIFDAPSRLGGA